MSGKRRWMWGGALALLVVGFAVRAYLGYVTPSVYWADEIYQTLEPAHGLAFGNWVEVWEYEDGLRSWLFPGILAAVMWVGEPLGVGSTGYMGSVVAFLSLVSLIPAVVTLRWADHEFGGSVWPLVAMAFPVVWFELVYFAPKALYEVFTAHLVVAAIALVRFSDGEWLISAAGGVVLGFCIMNRPHLAPVAVVLGLATPWFSAKPHRTFSALVVGVVAGVSIGGIVDAISYGVPFHSVIVNFHTNVIEGKASQWGTSPPWQYAVWVWQVATPVGALAIAAALVVGVYRYPALGWSALIVVIAHSAIPHKEYRFIYPAVVMATMIVGLEAARLGQWLSRKLDRRWAERAVGAGLVVALAGLSVYGGLHFKLRSTGGTGPTLNWQHHRGKLLAYRYLSQRDDICGVGHLGFPFWVSGGYTYLHHDIPVGSLGNEADLRSHRRGIDAFAASNWDRKSFGEFRKEKCFDAICVYVRPGDCPGKPTRKGPYDKD